MTNCTFSLNKSKAHDSGKNTGGAIYCQEGDYEGDGIVTLLNCILWGDVDHDDKTDELGGPGTFNVSYSDVKGGWSEGTGNIDGDPKFCNRDGNTNFDGYFLNHDAPSPCISAASGSADDLYDGDDNDNYNEEYSTDPVGTGTMPRWIWATITGMATAPTSNWLRLRQGLKATASS